MTATVLTPPRGTAAAAAARQPLLQRLWEGLQAMGERRAASVLRRVAAKSYGFNPEVSRTMLGVARELEAR